MTRALLIGLAIAAVIFAASGGQVLFLPLLFVPFGLFALRQRRQQTRA